jgi:hypothetical protein
MSPPAGAAAPAVHRGRTVAPGRPRVAPRGPRRISGPARRPARAGEQGAQLERGLAVGVIAAARGLPRERLDRLIRGRSWIALIAFALIGIVALQLMLLKLNAGIGRSLERESLLQRQNAALSIESSELASGNRVETQAAALGMELVPVSSLRFLTADPRGDAVRAASALRARAQTPARSSEQTAPGASSTEGGSESPAVTPSSSGEAATNTASGETSTEAPSTSESSSGSPAPAATSTPSSVAAPASGEASTAAGAAEAAPAGGEGAAQTGGAG